MCPVKLDALCPSLGRLLLWFIRRNGPSKVSFPVGALLA